MVNHSKVQKRMIDPKPHSYQTRGRGGTTFVNFYFTHIFSLIFKQSTKSKFYSGKGKQKTRKRLGEGLKDQASKRIGLRLWI